MATGNVFTLRMGAGFPGASNRDLHTLGEPNILDVTNTPTAYGDPVKIVAGKIQGLQSGDTLAVLYGFLERPFPTQQLASLTSQPFGSTPPVGGQSCTVIKRGYLKVTLQGTTTPLKNGPIFIRVGGTVPTGGKIGGLEAVVDGVSSVNSIALPGNSYFMGLPDSSGVTEIAYNL